jgi:hypothetical protein
MYLRGICLEGLRKRKKIQLGIVDFSAAILTWHLPKKKQKYYVLKYDVLEKKKLFQKLNNSEGI